MNIQRKKLLEAKLLKLIRPMVKEAIDSRSVGPYYKIGFNFFSLSKGDEIRNTKTKKTWIVQSVGLDGADLKDKWLDKYLTITSLKDWEPVNVKAMGKL